ncbi:MAG: hypothetical protein K2X99_08460, partial [Gemmatimonadaceae bacterium]|nr:hypothetical protein [Gemmatimonadaceae bacterium]
MLVAAAVLAWVSALLFAAADGAVLGMEDDDGPLPPDAAVIVERRERSHRALAFARILCQLTAGAAVALLWRRAGADWSSAPLLAGTALAVILGESLARTTGDVLGARVLAPLAWLVRLAEVVLAPVVTIGTMLDA